MLDLVITTETWLTDQDYLWLKATELNRNNLQIHNVNRQHSKGGGLALICRGTYAVKTLKIVTNEIVEIVTWVISIGTKTVHITGVPPTAKKWSYQHDVYYYVDRLLNNSTANDQ